MSPQPAIVLTGKICPTQRAPDWWESARFQAFCVARNWFRQSGVISSRPPAGNASRWAAKSSSTKETSVMSIHPLTTHTDRAFLTFMVICLGFFIPSCSGLSLSPFTTQTPLPLPSLTPTLEECSWYVLLFAWNDSNGDGLQHANEPPLANIRFFSEDPSHKSEKIDHGTTGTGGSIGLVELLPGCFHFQFEVYPEVQENCQLTTTPARMLADTRKENQEFSFGFLCH